MHHMFLGFGFFLDLVDWLGFSSSMETSGLTENIGNTPISGRS
jgi:hypothetical protein